MERKNQTTQVNIRMPDGLLELLDDDVNKSQEFSSRADYILAAIRYFQDYRTKILAERKLLENQQEDDFVVSPEKNLQDNLI